LDVLASLLPGLRDVRTPLTVGYLWLVIGWVAVGDVRWLTDRPAEEGIVSQLFDIQTVIGRGAALAALSFLAYLLGALLTIPLEGRIGRVLLEFIQTIPALSSLDARVTRDEFLALHRQLEREVEILQDGLREQIERDRGTRSHREQRDDAIRELDIAISRGRDVGDLRARLLVTNQGLYGEYDRLAAEASFRINVATPVLGIAILVRDEWGVSWFLIPMFASLALLLQGLSKHRLAATVLMRAVIDTTIEHPLRQKVEQVRQRFLLGLPPQPDPGPS
jgi:hypothetical protein